MDSDDHNCFDHARTCILAMVDGLTAHHDVNDVVTALASVYAEFYRDFEVHELLADMIFEQQGDEPLIDGPSEDQKKDLN